MELPVEDRSDATVAESFMQKHMASSLKVEAKGLSYHYEDGMPILSDSDFVADAGQIVTFVGPSGEGKTTLLRLLLGLVEPYAGKAALTGSSGTNYFINAGTRQVFAYVPQGNSIFSGTVESNLRTVKPDATEEEMLAAAKPGQSAKRVVNVVG